MSWIGEDKIDTNKHIGFIYKITHKETGMFYIGKKNLISYKTINKKKVYSESNWRGYYGSNKEFLAYIKSEGKDKFIREIIVCCETSIQLTYNEIKYCILMDWESDKCFNSNILGKIFKSKITNKK